jgi:PAS domain S-box-containing protein
MGAFARRQASRAGTRAQAGRADWQLKLAGLLVLILGGTLLFQLLYVVPFVSDSAVRLEKHLEESTVRSIAVQLDSDLESTISRLTEMAGRAPFANMDLAAQRSALDTLSAGSLRIGPAGVLDAGGRFVSVDSEEAFPLDTTASYADDPLFAVPFQQGTTYCDAPAFEPEEQSLYFIVTVPVSSDTGRSVGVLLAVLMLNHLVEMVADYPLEEAMVAVVVDREGTVVAHSDVDLRSLEAGPLSLTYDDSWLQQNVEGETATVVAEHEHDGTSYYGTGAILPSTGWRVVVERPMSLVLSGADALAQRMLGANTMLAAVALLGGFLLIRQVAVRQSKYDRALRTSERRYRRLFEQSLDAIYIAMPDGTIVDANPAWLQMFGCSREDLARLKAGDFYVDPGDRPGLLRHLSIDGFARGELPLKKKDGTPFVCEYRLIATMDEDGGPVIHQGVLRDVTERKRMEEELKENVGRLEQANARLREMDQLKSVFLASMSHELRTPLNSIIGFTGVILMGIAGVINEEQRKQLTMVRTSASHLLDLINDVLDISKIEANKVELAVEEFSLSGLVEEVIAALAPGASQKGLEIAAEIPAGIVVRSDRRRVKQVLVNLIGNAVKFTDQGHVGVSVGTPANGEVHVRVSDTGTGIREEDMRNLFQPFQQVGPSLTKKHEGTGLGLYLTDKLARLLHARIAARSEYGKGSEFTFTIPLKYEEDRSHETTAGS